MERTEGHLGGWDGTITLVVYFVGDVNSNAVLPFAYFVRFSVYGFAGCRTELGAMASGLGV